MSKQNTAKILFMGTPEFAVPTLEALHKSYGVAAVVTAPDKARGRGRAVLPTPVKQYALEHNIPTLEPHSLKDPAFVEQVKSIAPDIICVVAFRILPRAVYSLAGKGAFNIHGSLLPRYRGAAPIQWSIIEGEKTTGVTSFLLADTVDTGSIIGTRQCAIDEGMTACELHDRLMPLAADLAVETCRLLWEGTATPVPQDDSLATPAPKIFKETCKIDWTLPAQRLCNFIHGFSPVPGAWTLLDGTTLKVLKSAIGEAKQLLPGQWKVEGEEWIVGTGEGCVVLTLLQLQGKKVLPAADFIRGYRGEQTGFFT